MKETLALDVSYERKNRPIPLLEKERGKKDSRKDNLKFSAFD